MSMSDRFDDDLVSSTGEINALLEASDLLNVIFLILCNVYSCCSLLVPLCIYLVETYWSLLFTFVVGVSLFK